MVLELVRQNLILIIFFLKQLDLLLILLHILFQLLFPRLLILQNLAYGHYLVQTDHSNTYIEQQQGILYPYHS